VTAGRVKNLLLQIAQDCFRTHQTLGQESPLALCRAATVSGAVAQAAALDAHRELDDFE